MSTRNIALNRSSISAIITFLAGLLVSFGVLPQATGDAVASQGSVIVGAVFTVVAAVHALVGILIHKKVTPVSDPKDNDGNMLVPAPKPSEATYVQSPGGDAKLPDPLGIASQ